MDEILVKTLKFFLGSIAAELNKDIDWRAKGYGKNVFIRAGIYFVAMVRDLIRIPTHHKEGIAQSRFRARIEYISKTVIPSLNFFKSNYPIDDGQHVLITEAIELLNKGVSLISDGAIPKLDEWYATMDEFYELTMYSQQAAQSIEELIDFKTS